MKDLLTFCHPTPLACCLHTRQLPILLLSSFMASSSKIHPTTLVTNIKTHVPIQLDDEGTNFNTWITLFKPHCRAYLVDTHIIPDDSFESVAKDSAWQRLDDVWLYGTISPTLLQFIVRTDDYALDSWKRIENNF